MWQETRLEAGGQGGDCHSASDKRELWPEQVWEQWEGECVRPPAAVELEARGQRQDVRMREGKESQRMPRPLPQKLTWASAVHGHSQAVKREESVRGAQRKADGQDIDS